MYIPYISTHIQSHQEIQSINTLFSITNFLFFNFPNMHGVRALLIMIKKDDQTIINASHQAYGPNKEDLWLGLCCIILETFDSLFLLALFS